VLPEPSPGRRKLRGEDWEWALQSFETRLSSDNALDIFREYDKLIDYEQFCGIPGSKLIPLGEVPKRMAELNSADEIVVHCKSGVRSAKAVDLLMKSGFRKIHNLKGGILAWSEQVDPSVPKY